MRYGSVKALAERRASAKGGDAMQGRHAGLEAGGTKMVLGVADGDGTILARKSLPTGAPGETVAAIRRVFEGWAGGGRFASLGIGTFGPAGTVPGQADYGRITVTPKAGWAGTDLLGALSDLAEATAFDTDVNAAAVAEAKAWGKGGTLAYVTAGTGIGAGVARDGVPLAGTSHYEAGHVAVPRAPGDEGRSVCSFHEDCAEGLASGPSWQARYGRSLSELPGDHEVHGHAAFYLGALCRSLLFLHAPSRIVLGGGVMRTPGLLDRVAEETARQVGRYGAFADERAFEVTAPALGGDSGLKGAVLLGMATLEGGSPPSA
jgi:fructokinase